MWSISNLKNRGKEAFKRNYWKCVLIGLLVTLVAGGAGAGSGAGASRGFSTGFNKAIEEQSSTGTYEDELEHYFENEFSEEFGYDEFDYDFEDDFSTGRPDGMDSIITGAMIGAVIGIVCIIALVAIVIAILLDLFVNLPLEVGTCRFFFKNQKTEAKVSEVTFAYDNHWKNVAVTMFFRDLFTFFWTLLFIIPGIVKAYEYRMIPYILAENPDMERKDVFALSKKMMDGEKWHAFVLDLSFIGWHILGVLTAGILEVFYVVPYKSSTDATLYEALKYLKLERPSETVEPTQNIEVE